MYNPFNKKASEKNFNILYEEFAKVQKMAIINRKYVVDLVKEINILRKELKMKSLKQRKIEQIKLEKELK